MMMLCILVVVVVSCCDELLLLSITSSRARLLSEYEIAATTDPEPIVRDFFFGERERWW